MLLTKTAQTALLAEETTSIFTQHWRPSGAVIAVFREVFQLVDDHAAHSHQNQTAELARQEEEDRNLNPLERGGGGSTKTTPPGGLKLNLNQPETVLLRLLSQILGRFLEEACDQEPLSEFERQLVRKCHVVRVVDLFRRLGGGKFPENRGEETNDPSVLGTYSEAFEMNQSLVRCENVLYEFLKEEIIAIAGPDKNPGDNPLALNAGGVKSKMGGESAIAAAEHDGLRNAGLLTEARTALPTLRHIVSGERGTIEHIQVFLKRRKVDFCLDLVGDEYREHVLSFRQGGGGAMWFG